LGGQKDDLRASAERSIGRVGLIALECIEFALGRSAAASASFEEHADDDSDEHGVSDVATLVDELIDGSGSSACGATVSANGCVALFVFGLLALVDAVWQRTEAALLRRHAAAAAGAADEDPMQAAASATGDAASGALVVADARPESAGAAAHARACRHLTSTCGWRTQPRDGPRTTIARGRA
jgi:hypothetical protein